MYPAARFVRGAISYAEIVYGLARVAAFSEEGERHARCVRNR